MQSASALPVTVAGVGTAGSVAAGWSRSGALFTGGGVRYWGSNIFGERGDGSGDGSFIPVDVSGFP
jgi:hypothetical protein